MRTSIKHRLFLSYLSLLLVVLAYLSLSLLVNAVRTQVENDRIRILELKNSWDEIRITLADMVINWNNGRVYEKFLREKQTVRRALHSTKESIQEQVFYPVELKDLVSNLEQVWRMADVHLLRISQIVEHPDFRRVEALVQGKPGLQRINHLLIELSLEDAPDSRRLIQLIQQLILEIEYFPIYTSTVEHMFEVMLESSRTMYRKVDKAETVVKVLFFLAFLIACIWIASRFTETFSTPVIELSRKVREFAGLSGAGEVGQAVEGGDTSRPAHSVGATDELFILRQTVDSMFQHYTDLSRRAQVIAQGNLEDPSLQFPQTDVVSRSLGEIYRYLHELVDATARIRDGEYGLQIIERSEKDILTRNFNVMSAVIQDKIHTLRSMFEAVDEAVLVVDESRNLVETNSRLFRLLGYSYQEEKALAFIRETVLPRLDSLVDQALKGRTRSNHSTRLYTRKGHPVPVKVNVRLLPDSESKENQVMILIRDESWKARARREQDRLKAHAAFAELRALRAQINPHFFFNTLNTIAHLIEIGSEEAARTVQQLADLFRYSLATTRTELVPLEDEIQHIRKFLGVLALRYGERLKVEYSVENELQSHLVPPMLLQPLVENAVRYGENRNGEVHLRIQVEQRNGDLVIEVQDSGSRDVNPETLLNRAGVGIGNVNERFRTLYGRDVLFRKNHPCGLVAEMRIPLHPGDAT
ncbi:MAG: hypothetical protein Kow009_10000 [Spirochaetales bacterium]